MEDGVRPGEVDLGQSLGGDALTAQDGVGVAALNRRDHVDPRHPDPFDGAAEFDTKGFGDPGLIALPTVFMGPQREQRRRFGVQARQPQRFAHGASFQYISRSQSVT